MRAASGIAVRAARSACAGRGWRMVEMFNGARLMSSVYARNATMTKTSWIERKSSARALCRGFSSDSNDDTAQRAVKEMDKVSCQLKMEDPESGEVFVDTSRENESPVDFVVGVGQVIVGIEKKVVGLKVGESWSGMIGPEECFGFRVDSKVHDISLVDGETGKRVENVPEVGTTVQLNNNTVGKVVEVGTDSIKVDTNHPLAGRTVKLSLTVEAIMDGSQAFSGVQVQTTAPGDGTNFPQAGDTVAVHYVGMLASDGKIFDQSKPRNPIQFRLGVGQVIRGWDEGIARLSLGERARLHIASEFAYGASGVGGGVIPPHANLVFDVQLVQINEKKSSS